MKNIRIFIWILSVFGAEIYINEYVCFLNVGKQPESEYTQFIFWWRKGKKYLLLLSSTLGPVVPS